MKLCILTFCLLLVTSPGFTQETRDHRSTGNRGKRATDLPPVPPPPVTGKHKPGPAVTTIDPNKWYFIKQVYSGEYLEMSGHRSHTRSMAFLAVEKMHSENTSQQWRIKALWENNGEVVYEIENRKYFGKIVGSDYNLFIDPRRGARQFYFFMVPNPDKTWFIVTSDRGGKKGLNTQNKNRSHCYPYQPDPILGGRVLADCECASTMRRKYITYENPYPGPAVSRWILEEVIER